MLSRGFTKTDHLSDHLADGDDVDGKLILNNSSFHGFIGLLVLKINMVTFVFIFYSVKHIYLPNNKIQCFITSSFN